jgi:hypothetical protein
MLQQLGSNEAILLMYLADELPPEDRAEVEQMLATDPGLRAALDEAREANASFVAAMPALDRSSRLPAPESVGVRRVMRTMRQWHERRLTAPPVVETQPGLRYPWWAYPLAAAASVVIAFLVWWGNTDRTDRGYVRRDVISYPDRATDADLLAEVMTMGGPVDEPYVLTALDPSDAAVLMLVDEPAGTERVPGNDAQPPDNETDEDEFPI